MRAYIWESRLGSTRSGSRGHITSDNRWAREALPSDTNAMASDGVGAKSFVQALAARSEIKLIIATDLKLAELCAASWGSSSLKEDAAASSPRNPSSKGGLTSAKDRRDKLWTTPCAPELHRAVSVVPGDSQCILPWHRRLHPG